MTCLRKQGSEAPRWDPGWITVESCQCHAAM